MANRAIIVFIAVACMAGPQLSAAQNVQPSKESVVAELVHADSGSTLTLTTREVVFEFTPVGVERARRRADSTMAGFSDRAMVDLVRTSLHGAFRDMRIRFKIADVAGAESLGRTVMIRFKSTRADQNNQGQKTFDFDAIDDSSAQAFTRRLNRAATRRN